MKPWKILVALCCILSTAAVARASVLFQGLQYSPVGSGVVHVGADGRLVVSNLGSSGLDGVSIGSQGSDGARIALDGVCSAADAGASVSLAFSWKLVSQPAGSQAQLNSSVAFSVLGGHCVCVPDWSTLASSSTQTVTLYRDGGAVYSALVDRASSVDVAFDPVTGQCPNPALSCAKSGKASPKLCEARCSFPSLVRVSVAGHDVDCDEVSFRCPVDEDCDGVSCELRVTAPPGSSFSQVRCSDGSCRLYDHWVSASGAATLDMDAFAATPSSSAVRRLEVHNLGSSGQEGVELKLSRRAPSSGGGAGGSAYGDVDGDGVAATTRYAPPGLYFDPATDEGASSVITVTGHAFSSTGGALGAASAALTLTVQGSNFYAIPSHVGGGATQEWVAVMSHGLEVGRAVLPAGGWVHIIPPPNEPLGMAINEKGLPDDAKPTKRIMPKGSSPFGARPASVQALTPDYSRGHAVELRCPLHASFAGGRLFVIGGQQFSGNEIQCFSDDGSGAYDGTFVPDRAGDYLRCPNPASALSSMALLDLTASGGDPIGPVVSDVSLSSAHTCVSIPVMYARTDSTPVRAFSATFHLSPELASCAAGVTEGDYLSKVAGTQMFVTDNGGGSYTVDCGILGPVCGATGDGTLFTLALSATQPLASGVGAVVMDAVTVRDCSNQPVPADPGQTGYVPIQFASPPAVSGLTATTRKSGNTVAGITGGAIAGIVVARPPGSSSTAMDVYRKGFGNYPLYDNAPNAGAVPSPPATPAAALAGGWTPVTCGSGTCSAGTCAGTCTPTSVTDLPPSRDFEYYVAFARDLYGNTSPVSNMTAGTLDYFLGDVTDGLSSCSGDDHVDIADISALGAHYGSSVATFPSLACLDVGPTTDYSVDARPTTDGKIGFEDFVMFAINFSVVSAPQLSARPMAAATDAARLTVPAMLPAVGQTFDASVAVDGAGDAQALSVRLAFDPAVLEQVGVASGALLDAQGRSAAVLSSGPGDVDAALLGTGPGIAGSGELARVTFRVKAQGDARLALAGVSARDVANRPVLVAGVDAGAVADARSGLGILFPNPFRQAVEIRLSLRRDGAAKLAVYDVAGRHVRTLLQGVQPAGARTVTWDGNDEAGIRMAPGAYVVRFEAPGRSESRTVHLVR